MSRLEGNHVEDFIGDIEDYYGAYKAQQRDVTVQYVAKRFRAEDLPKVKKYIYENSHANYGAPTVSGIKRAIDIAYKEDKVVFGRPMKSRNGKPLWKCGGCQKTTALDAAKRPWCGVRTAGNGHVIVPHGYFD